MANPQVAALQQQIASLQAQLDALNGAQQALADAEQQITVLQQQLADANAQLAAEQAKDVTDEATIADLTAKLADAQAKDVADEATISDLTAKLAALQPAPTTPPPIVDPPPTDPPPIVTPPPSPAVNTTITFTEGVPARISVAGLLPTDADRYHGQWEFTTLGTYWSPSLSTYIPGVHFDMTTKEVVYDGSPLTGNPNAVTPNTGYYVGFEKGPYNAAFPFPVPYVTSPPPATINGVAVAQSIHLGSKHVAARYCKLDGKIRFYGGDWWSPGLGTSLGGQDGRMLMFAWDPNTNVWSLDYPARGKVGDQMPLNSDRMNMDWDDTNGGFWISHGSCRLSPGGYQYNNVPAGWTKDPKYCWKGDGGLADAYPEYFNDEALPLFFFDQKAQTFRLACANPILLCPWPQSVNGYMASSAFDNVSHRLYNMNKGGNGFDFHYIDVTNFKTDPTSLKWVSNNMDLRAGAPNNLTGTGAHFGIYGPGQMRTFCDEQARLLYFFDMASPALLGLTLPGHPKGEHKCLQIADLSSVIGYGMNMPVGAMPSATTSPVVWVPEHRSIVVLFEPQDENVGPFTRSFVINVDTGALTDGPRLPDNPRDGRPFFPNTGVWYPPTQEFITFGQAFMYDHGPMGRSWEGPWGENQHASAFWRYKWSA